MHDALGRGRSRTTPAAAAGRPFIKPNSSGPRSLFILEDGKVVVYIVKNVDWQLGVPGGRAVSPRVKSILSMLPFFLDLSPISRHGR